MYFVDEKRFIRLLNAYVFLSIFIFHRRGI